jgi:crotonobetainyl-CoA:carnitine CoA-transferase CaiB-like acyl-CoA transferase
VAVLSPYRVLDLTRERALLCGQILADLGADVIQVEPPGGAPARRRGPFLGDEPDPENSLHWWAFARNKRSVVLDLDSGEGQQTLRRLARSAHFLIESEDPGTMASRGLAYADLAALNPGLIHVSITPFGCDGPKAHHADSDLVLLAAGGALVLSGDQDRAPVRVGVQQAYLHAAAEAAVGALIAHHERSISGLGQHVGVSAQQAVAAATQSVILATSVGDEPMKRIAGGVRAGPLVVRFAYPAKDGHVSITHLFGPAVGPATRRLMQYVYDEGFCDAATRDKDWVAYTALLFGGEEPIEEFERVKQVIARFTATKTKAELFRAALDRGLLLAPVARLDELLASEQLAARDYFQTVEHEDRSLRIRYPGPFARLEASPIRYRRRPPRIGEHDREILAELPPSGIASTAAPAPRTAPASREPALAGVKVLDFMWAIAGPVATRTLADYGATVVRVESTSRMDICRTLHPYRGGKLDAEGSALFHNINAGKLMLTLDLGKPEGRDVALDLVRWADVVTESFSRKAMHGFGLGYEELRRVKPDLIMLSTCLMGQTGPLAAFAGYGNLAAAISGFYELAGWPDRDPAGPFGAYTDYIVPRYNAIAVLAALEHRRRTGRGQRIDLSQIEAALHFLAPAILDYTANGRVWGREGNRDREMSPHGVYRAAGADHWVAIAVRDDAQWRSLCEIIEQPGLAQDPRFATTRARLERGEELDAIIERFTLNHSMEEIEARLQVQGIPASAVQNSPELTRDPQLAHRGHFVTLSHPTGGTTTVEGSRIRLSATPARIEGSAPTFGRDNQRVLETILGYDEDRIAQLVISGALG